MGFTVEQWKHKIKANGIVTRNTFTYTSYHTKVTLQDIAHLAIALKETPHLTHLNLPGVLIGDEGAQVLLSALETHPNLISLNLKKNRLGLQGAQAIAHFLKKNNRLIDLSLAFNHLKDEGARWIARALEENHTIRYLDLTFNQITDKGATRFIRVLENACCICELKLDAKFQIDDSHQGNIISPCILTSLNNALKHNTCLIKAMDCVDKQEKHLAQAYAELNRLKKVSLKGQIPSYTLKNSISDELLSSQGGYRLKPGMVLTGMVILMMLANIVSSLISGALGVTTLIFLYQAWHAHAHRAMSVAPSDTIPPQILPLALTQDKTQAVYVFLPSSPKACKRTLKQTI